MEISFESLVTWLKYAPWMEPLCLSFANFANVRQQLKRIGLTIASLNQGCEEMKRHISVAHRETAPVLQESAELLKQKDQVESKQQLLKAFNTHSSSNINSTRPTGHAAVHREQLINSTKYLRSDQRLWWRLGLMIKLMCSKKYAGRMHRSLQQDRNREHRKKDETALPDFPTKKFP